MSLEVLAFGYGLVSAAIIALAAVGFSFQFGISKIFNVSYGAMMSVSAFVAYYVDIILRTSLWLGLVAGGISGAVLGLASERLLFSPFQRRRPAIAAVIILSLALDFFTQNAINAIAGPGFFSYRLPPETVFRFVGTAWTPLELVFVGLAVFAMVSVHLLLTQTRFGTAMRATAADRALASSCGINVRRSTSLAWAMSGLLAGLSGVVLAADSGAFSFVSGDTFFLVVFAAAVVGGLGHTYGAMIGALVVGIVTEEVAVFSPSLKYVSAFGVLIVLLIISPGGILQIAGKVRSDVISE